MTTLSVYWEYHTLRQQQALRPVNCPLPITYDSELPITLSCADKLSTLPFMSHAHSASSSSNFELIINNALDQYKKRTKNDLLVHPLATQLQSCDSPSVVLAVLQQ